jgi:hypothetical protein
MHGKVIRHMRNISWSLFYVLPSEVANLLMNYLLLSSHDFIILLTKSPPLNATLSHFSPFLFAYDSLDKQGSANPFI